jgi:hypothetical protein
LRTHFVFQLNREWSRNEKLYAPIRAAVDTPFTTATERELAWNVYRSALERLVDEALFDEPFSLRQIYIPLRAYFLDDPVEFAKAPTSHPQRRAVVNLELEIDSWLKNATRDDAIRIISGGPGSGKSSFARMYAAKLAHESRCRVLFVPLHQFDPSADLETAVGEFVRMATLFPYNPLSAEDGDTHLLLIFDGLDELALQGKVASDVALAFVREVQRQTDLRNHNSVRLQVLMTGREVVVQSHTTEFRKRGAILHVLAYYVPSEDTRLNASSVEYVDPGSLLGTDQRNEWWRLYGKVSGKGFQAMPDELRRPAIDDITAQPLLNYLVALSFTRGEVDFTSNVNLNSIYKDLIEAVHQRAYAGHTHLAIRGMELSQFVRVMEEIGLAAWHGDGRTTTVRDIEEHCSSGGLAPLLEVFQEGAKSGVTRLLTAFYFRQHGSRRDGEKTFEFTHKSFGEYLIAMRVVRALDVMYEELDRRTGNVDRGWSERDALKHWIEICGPAALDTYLAAFVRQEVALRPDAARQWQTMLEKLIGYCLMNGTPLERLEPRPRFTEEQRLARNAEEALLVVLNATARVTERVSEIAWPDRTTAGQWISRLQGQRSGPSNGLALQSLSRLDLSNCTFDINDFYEANLRGSRFRHSDLNFANCMQVSAAGADFEGARLLRTTFEDADLTDSNFRGAIMDSAKFKGATMRGAIMDEARISLAAAKEWARRGVKSLESEQGVRGRLRLLSGVVDRGPERPSLRPVSE